MLIKNAADIASSEITPKSVYMGRRKFLAGISAATAILVAGHGALDLISPTTALAAEKLGAIKGQFSTDERQTSYKDVTHYNNFYEFGADKEDPAKNAQNFKTSSWMVSVEGLVNKPRKFNLDEIMKMAPLEERVYRHRCVEGWSIVVPWVGYPLNVLIRKVEPLGKAKFIAFQSFYDPKVMPISRHAGIPFPYLEGLRIDEALHPLTLLCVGMYGEALPNQDGAPVRLVVPWKYGFKSIKSIVKMRFLEEQPPTTWNMAAPNEYGFYSNVNPEVDHPRWSQATERRLGEFTLFSRRKTLIFNGYADQVASLYSGMDLRKYV
jgi:methionine sulfoxide reductase catalytic subunit